MATPIIVVGHRNPDNDSISAAVGYAYLKNELAKRNGTSDEVTYIPARLGPLPPESAWVLETYGLPVPQVIPHLYARVEDVMTENPISVAKDATVMDAGRLLRKANVRSLVVTDDDGTYYGIISDRSIARRYIASTDMLTDKVASAMSVAADLIESLEQPVSDLTMTDVLTLNREDLLKDASEDLLGSELREAVIIDEANHCIGIITRSDVARSPKRQVILVDHNETTQAALGIESADVVEIIDHHRIADVMTSHPIQFLNLPVGSTATIVTMEFRKYNVDIPKPYAAVLLSAIMTDTVILKSPTATPTDEKQAQFLANILGEDVVEFGVKVFKARGGEDDIPVEELVGADSKEFQLGDMTVLIAQHETIDLPAVMAREDEIRTYMRKLLETHKYEFVLLLITDIMAEGSQFLVEGNNRIVNRVFGVKVDVDGGVWMPGILSRKKQVAPRILGS